MKPNITVTVIIPVYNAARLIVRCIESVLSQHGVYEKEIIVIDDGSTDDTSSIIKNNYHTKIILINQENKGPAAARNKGIEIATGEYLTFLDADDYWSPYFIHQTVTFLESNEELIGVSVGQKHRLPGKPDSVVPRFLTGRHEFNEPTILEDFYKFWAENNHLCTGSVMIRTDAVRLTGGQRTDLRCAEDLEFWAYLGTFGRIGFIPKVLFYSDGGIITKEVGWFKKNYKRWKHSGTPEEWEIRIRNRLQSINESSYESVKGVIISKNLILPLILSFRFKKAFKAVKQHNDIFPENRANKIIVTAQKMGIIPFYVLCSVLLIKEYFK